MSDIKDNLARISAAIKAAGIKAGRAADDVRLVAVSKGHDATAVRTALAAGQTVFGENRVQEAKGKFVSLRQEHPSLRLHLIGPLQTNKAEDAARIFDVIATLDRPALADALAKAMTKTGRTPRLYVEINLGNEPQKAGLTPEALPAFLDYCKNRGLEISGLMCIPPQKEDAAPHFARMKDLATRHGLKELSMGMSGDFETAIACGSTEVRIGTALFGKR